VIWKAVVVFTLAFALDFVWIFYTKAVQRHVALAASFWAATIIVFNGITQIGYVTEHWLLVPATAGAFIGTYIAMKRSKA
jgi:hypothetical protein